MTTFGLILSGVIALALAVFLGFFSDSIILGLIVFIVGWGYLYGKWVEGGTPYDIRDIRDELKKK